MSVCLSVLANFTNFLCSIKATAVQLNVPRMNINVLASYTENIARGLEIMLNNGWRINAVYNECFAVLVGDQSWGWG